MSIILRTNILLKQTIQTSCKIKKTAIIAQLFIVCVMKKHPCFGLFLLAVVLRNFRQFMIKQIEKYGNCLTIVIGGYDGKQAAFLLQNMFPITEKYLDHIHTRNNNLTAGMTSNFLQFPNKIINNPYFLCIYPIYFLRLSNQDTVNQPIQHCFIKFRNSGITPDFPMNICTSPSECSSLLISAAIS